MRKSKSKVSSFKRKWLTAVSLFTFGLFCMATDGFTSSKTEEHTSKLVHPGDDGKLVYEPFTEKGDVIPDFSYCGYKRSEEPIPDVPVAESVKPAKGETSKDGSMAYPKGPDSTKLIQDAIDKVSNMPVKKNGFRGAVLLKKGTYFITKAIKIKTSGVVLRGEGDGENGTVIIAKDAKANIQLGALSIKGVKGADAVLISSDYVPAGSCFVEVEKVNGFKEGEYIQIWKTPNQKWVDDLGMNVFAGSMKGKTPWTPDKYRIPHLRKITKIKGKKIHFDLPLPQSITSEYGGGKVSQVEIKEVVENCGVEALRLISDYDTKITEKPSNKGIAKILKRKVYFSDEENTLMSGIDVSGMNNWVRNCTMLHIRKSAVQLTRKSLYCTVRDCRSFDPVSLITGARRYTFWMNGTAGLIYRCYAEYGRHDFAQHAKVPGPNVFLDSFGNKVFESSEPHHRWATGTLFDNIKIVGRGGLAAANRGGCGSGHGWMGVNIVFWNSDADFVVIFSPPTPEENFAIGYTGKKKKRYDTGHLNWTNMMAGLKGKPNAGKYKGYALMGNGYIEVPDREATPRSLFFKQLIDRIGKEQVSKIYPDYNRIGKWED